MAIAAVLLSIPMALFFAVYGYATHMVNAPQGMLVYSAVGTAIMVSFTLFHGVRLHYIR
ncbi:MAG: hypothetical protein AAF230_06450 [Pseudomonadota bacterium]